MMKDKKFRVYYVLSCMAVLIASYYPLSMGIRVVGDMIADGVVLHENYPKYVIPYTPISLAVILGVFLMPFCKKRFVVPAAISLGVFFLAEILLEKTVMISSPYMQAELEAWQMSMCAVPPDGGDWLRALSQPKTPVEILMGNYSPAFKLHFYLISVVLILAILNCFYGFGKMIRTGEKKRRKTLILQSVFTAAFLGLCILACFTAFWRDGNILVGAVSAVLMALFFILLGVTVGSFAGSFLLHRANCGSVWLPALIASVVTLLMYFGEMILLGGYLYRFGTGFFFDGLPLIVLAPVDLLIILAPGGICAALFAALNRKSS